jgi:hypothetical protein
MSTLMKLSATNPIAQRVMDAFNADQPRDERGRWGEGGPGSGATHGSEHKASSDYHAKAAIEHGHRGEMEAGRAHALAAVAHQKASYNSQDVSHASRNSELTRTAQKASAKANAETAKVGAKPIDNSKNQAGGYRGNPAAKGSRSGIGSKATWVAPGDRRSPPAGGGRWGTRVPPGKTRG